MRHGVEFGLDGQKIGGTRFSH